METNSADSTLIGVSSLVVAPQLHQAVFRNKATWWIACQVFDHAPQIYGGNAQLLCDFSHFPRQLWRSPHTSYLGEYS
jgi:hypothetical protein